VKSETASPAASIAFFHGAIPYVEQAHHGAGWAEPFHSVTVAQKQGRQMAAVRVAQPAGALIVFGEEESSEIPTCRVFVKQNDSPPACRQAARVAACCVICRIHDSARFELQSIAPQK